MLYLLGGDNIYRSTQRLRELKEDFLQEYNGTISVFNADEIEDYKAIVQDVDNLSLFSTQKLIIVKRILSAREALLKEFQSYVEQVENINIIIWEDIPLDKRRGIYKFVQKKGVVEEFKKLTYPQLKSWISRYLQEKMPFDIECVDMLLLKVGDDQMQLASIMDNLIILAKANKQERLTLDCVSSFVAKTAEESIWELVDAVGACNKRSALIVVESLLREQRDFSFIIAMIARQLRIITQTKHLHLIGKNYAETIKILKLHPFVIRKCMAHARNFSFKRLKKLYQKLVQTDLVVKEGRFDGKLALNLFIAVL